MIKTQIQFILFSICIRQNQLQGERQYGNLYRQRSAAKRERNPILLVKLISLVFNPDPS